MADKTLNDVVMALRNSNAKLEEVATYQRVYGESSRQELLALQNMFMRYFKADERKRKSDAGDDLEERREQNKKANEAATDRKQRAMPSSPFSGFKMPFAGLGTAIGAALTPAALMAFGKRLLKGGLLMFLAAELGNRIGDYFQKDEKFKEGLTDAIRTAGFLSIFTRNLPFIAVAAAIKGVLTPEQEKELVDAAMRVGESIKELFTALPLPSIEQMSTFLVDGINGIHALLTGDFGSLFGTKEGENGKIVETLTSLALLGAVFAPKKALALAITTARGAWSGIIGSIRMLGGLGTSVGNAGSAVAQMNRQQLLQQTRGLTDAQLRSQGFMRGKDGAITNLKGQNVSDQALRNLSTNVPKGPRNVKMSLRGAGGLRALGTLALGVAGGPIGLAITAAALAGTAAYAISQTEEGKSFIKKYILPKEKTAEQLKEEEAKKNKAKIGANQYQLDRLNRALETNENRLAKGGLGLSLSGGAEKTQETIDRLRSQISAREEANMMLRRKFIEAPAMAPSATTPQINATSISGDTYIDESTTATSAMVLPDGSTTDHKDFSFGGNTAL